MNPHIFPGEPGWREDASKEEEGANYLRRLKTADQPSPDPRVTQGNKLAAAMDTLGFKERRIAPRIRCSGSVEFQVQCSDARMWGTLTDISLHGCYVEMSNTFPVDTKVKLVLKSCGIKVETAGVVRASYPALGMGIALKHLSPEEEQHLKQLIAVLNGHNSASPNQSAKETADIAQSEIHSLLEAADPKLLLDQINNFFQKSPLLSRDEFHQIARRICKP